MMTLLDFSTDDGWQIRLICSVANYWKTISLTKNVYLLSIFFWFGIIFFKKSHLTERVADRRLGVNAVPYLIFDGEILLFFF